MPMMLFALGEVQLTKANPIPCRRQAAMWGLIFELPPARVIALVPYLRALGRNAMPSVVAYPYFPPLRLSPRTGLDLHAVAPLATRDVQLMP